MEDIDWDDVVKIANTTRRLLDEKPSSQKIGLSASVTPGGILNAYREGDLNFKEAVELFICWRKTTVSLIE